MSVKVQAKVNASVDYVALEEELFWKAYGQQLPRATSEIAAWSEVRPVYESQQAMRVGVTAEEEGVEALKVGLEAHRQAQAEAAAALSGKLARRRREHERTMRAMRSQQTASVAELERLRQMATAAGVELPEQAPSPSVLPAEAAEAAQHAESVGEAMPMWHEASSAHAEYEAARFGAARLGGGLDGDALEAAARRAARCARRAAGGGSDSSNTDQLSLAEQTALEETVDKYRGAVEMAWADVQRLEDERQQVDALHQESENEAARLERQREEMEATLHEVASDLGRLALLYRTQGKAPHAVPLYMTALAIYEKTLGPDHPEVAKDLVNLGNAFCDQAPLPIPKASGLPRVTDSPPSVSFLTPLTVLPPCSSGTEPALGSRATLSSRPCHRSSRAGRFPPGSRDGPLKSRYRLPRAGSQRRGHRALPARAHHHGRSAWTERPQDPHCFEEPFGHASYRGFGRRDTARSASRALRAPLPQDRA